MPPAPRTSVIIPARNADAFLPFQLEALAAQDHRGGWEVVVVDHRSSDRTGAVAAAYADRLPALRVQRTDRRGGANTARNDGARVAHGELLVFCDADDVADAGWLSAMVAAAADADVVAGRLDTRRLNDERSRRWRFDDDADLDVTDVARIGFLPYAPAGNVVVRAEVLWALGGFPEGYRRGCDEMALMWRAQRAGYRFAVAPTALMHYRLSDRLGVLARQHFGYRAMEAKLYREFRDAGMPRSNTRAALSQWWALGRGVGDLFASAERRGVWLRIAASSAGRAWGSVRNRVVYL